MIRAEAIARNIEQVGSNSFMSPLKSNDSLLCLFVPPANDTLTFEGLSEVRTAFRQAAEYSAMFRLPVTFAAFNSEAVARQGQYLPDLLRTSTDAFPGIISGAVYILSEKEVQARVDVIDLTENYRKLGIVMPEQCRVVGGIHRQDILDAISSAGITVPTRAQHIDRILRDRHEDRYKNASRLSR